MKGNYLITSDCWFVAPDGKQYKSAWGDVEIITDEFLGIKTNRNSSNWFAKIGGVTNHVIIAGCQIHYAVKCDEQPNTSKITEYTLHEGVNKPYERECYIWIAE